MTEQKKRFCDEYIIDLNATQSALRSGYSKKTAYSQGQRLLKDVEIQSRIETVNKKREERTQITADMVIKELALIAFQDSANLVNEEDSLKSIHGMGSDVSRTIAEVTSRTEKKGGEDAGCAEITKVKTYDKKGALDSLGKHFGIFEKDNKTEVVVSFENKTLKEIQEKLKNG